MVEAVLHPGVFPGAVHAGAAPGDRGLVRDRALRHPAGGPGDPELQKVEDHPGVQRAGILRDSGEERRQRPGGEVR